MDATRRALFLGAAIAALGATAIELLVLREHGGSLALLASLLQGDVFPSACVGAAFVIHFLNLGPGEQRSELAAGLVLEAIVFALRMQTGGWPLLGAGTGLGLWALSARALRVLQSRADPRRREDELRTLFDMSAFFAFAVISQPYLTITGWVRPAVYDPFALRVEAGFGAQPSVVATAWLRRAPWLRALCFTVYAMLPIAAAVVHGSLQRRDSAAPPHVLRSLFLLAAIGVPVYFVFPLIGPRAWLAEFPAYAFDMGALPDVPVPVDRSLPRNGMPSLHAAWALVLALRAGPGLRAAGWLWFGLTVLATLGLGEHYLVDLVPAIPLALAADGASLSGRRSAVVWTFALLQLASWLAVLRAGSTWLGAHPGILALAVLGTLAPPIALRWHALRACGAFR